jgi:hypothetical protein
MAIGYDVTILRDVIRHRTVVYCRNWQRKVVASVGLRIGSNIIENESWLAQSV